MKDDKKKVAVVGALFLVVLAIGAFRMVGDSGPATPTKPAEKKKDSAAANADTGPKNPMFSTPLAQRDPFTPAPPSAPTALTNPGLNPTDPKGNKDPNPITGPILPAIPANLAAIPIPTGRSSVRVPRAAQPSGPSSVTAAGVVLGSSPAAVLQDSAGNQFVVSVGETRGGVRVLRVTENSVTVSDHGSRRRLTVGENSNGK